MKTDTNKYATKPKFSTAEEKTRTDVAAGYRLLSLYGFTDLTDGFFSARLPDKSDEFVVGGYGLLPELAQASTLYKRSLKNKPKLEQFDGVDIDAYNFTKAALNSRPEFNACLHAHTEWGVSFASLDCKLEPTTQYGIMFHNKIGYLDYNDAEVTEGDACKQIVELFKQGYEILILRNHGFLVPGRTVAQAFFHLYRLEQAIRYQMRMMSINVEPVLPDEANIQRAQEQYWNMRFIHNDGLREWPSLMRKLDKIDPSYRY